MKLLEKIRQWLARQVLHAYSSYLRRWPRLRQSVSLPFNRALVTVFGVVLAALIYFQVGPFEVDPARISGSIFYAAGGLIGTMLALTFTLSAIPIQKATESFGNTVAVLYRRDIISNSIFLLLSLLCTGSIVLGLMVDSGTSPFSLFLLSLQILSFTVSLDLIRWYHIRVARLLTPTEAIQRLSRIAERGFVKHHRIVSRLAKIHWAALPDHRRRGTQPQDVEKALYQTTARNAAAFKYWTLELAEMASRSVRTGQVSVANEAMQQIVKLSVRYLEIRKESFILYPATFGVQSSDANDVLSPAYESLQDILTLACNQKDELSCIYAVRCVGGLVSGILSLEESLIEHSPFPINWLSMGYLEEAVSRCIEEGYLDAALEGIRILKRLVSMVPGRINHSEFFRDVVSKQGKFALRLMPSKNHHLAEEAIDGMLLAVEEAIKRKLQDRPFILSAALDELRVLVPVANVLCAVKHLSILNAPLQTAYSETHGRSLVYLLQMELEQCTTDNQRAWVSPYHDFLKLSDEIHQHFRKIAEEMDFGNSPILYHLIQMIQQIGELFLRAYKNPLREGYDDQDKLCNELIWMLAPLWAVFNDKQTVDVQRAGEACKVLAYLGLAFYEAGNREVPENALGFIVTIAKSWISVTERRNFYNSRDFIKFLWMFQYAAELRNDQLMKERAEAKIAELTESFSDEERPAISEASEQSKERIRKEIAQTEFRGLYRQTPEAVLRQLFDAQRRRPAEATE